MPELNKIIVSCDPGKNGAFVLMRPEGIECFKMPSYPKEVYDLLSEIKTKCSSSDIHFYIEDINASSQMGVVSAFTFGYNHGVVIGCLECLFRSYNLTRPQIWQRGLNCLTHGDKKISLAKAKKLFPSIHVYHWNADALLIAEYGRRHQIYLEKKRKLASNSDALVF